MRQVIIKGVVAIVCACLLQSNESVASPPIYATQTPAAEPAVRQERFTDPIDIKRLSHFVQSSRRESAKKDFASWNARRKDAPVQFLRKYISAKNDESRQVASYQAFQEQKAIAFDKLALFEQYRIGHLFFARGAKTMTGRVKYLQEMFQRMEPRQVAAGPLPTFAATFPNTSEYLATLKVGSTNLLKHFSHNFVECAHAEEGCPPAGRQKRCEASKDLCKPLHISMPFIPANNGPAIPLAEFDTIKLSCGHESNMDDNTHTFTALITIYEIAETFYVCADPSKNVSRAPSGEVSQKVYDDEVTCQSGSNSSRYSGTFTFDTGIEDGPIPDGCVGISKVRKSQPSNGAIAGVVKINAAPCWEAHWQCRYKADPIGVVTDVELMKVPEAPKCPS